MASILIAEDETAINDLVKRNLQLVGHRCVSVFDGPAAVAELQARTYDLVILDIMLPELDGFEVMKNTRGTPTIFLTARTSLSDRIAGLSMGADDYIVKPFEMLELLARVEAVLRRTRKTGNRFEAGDVTIDFDSRQVFYKGRPVDCTPKEYELLEMLVNNRNIALSRERLLERVWGYDFEGDSRTVDVQHYFVLSALTRDLHAVTGRGTDVDGAAGSLLRPYHDWSGGNVKLALYRDRQLVYSNWPEIPAEIRFAEPPGDGTRLVSKQKANGRTYVTVFGRLPEPYDSFALAYFYDLTAPLAAWNKTNQLLFAAGAMLSALLAVGLLVVLNRLFKPLQQISQISREIAAGAYGTRLPETGRDELAEMAKTFNHMAEEIQRQMTELVAAAEKKQQFVDNFAHELRTPLTAIYGYAEYLQKAALSEEDRLSALDYIMSESRRLQTMADQLLELAELANNEIHWETCKASALFHSVRKTLQSRLTEKEIRLDIQWEVAEIRGDASLLQSLFVNLIDNAVKACDPGGRISVRVFAEAGQTIATVRDNGKGMPAEVLGQITEPFYRAEKSRNRRDGGTGLGLAICKQIAARHSAELTFESRPGEGTTVTVTFPPASQTFAPFSETFTTS